MILDGTVVRVRLDRKATSISLLVVIGVREDGQMVLLSVRDMGGETTEAWRTVLDDLIGRGLWPRPEFLGRRLQAVQRDWRKAIAEDEIARLAGTTSEVGTFPEDLARSAKALGFKAEVREGLTIDEVQKFTAAGHPMIALAQVWLSAKGMGTRSVEDEWDSGHYIVVLGVDKDYVYYEDPYVLMGKAFMPRKLFEAHWHQAMGGDLAKHPKLMHVGIFVRGKKPAKIPAVPPAEIGKLDFARMGSLNLIVMQFPGALMPYDLMAEMRDVWDAGHVRPNAFITLRKDRDGAVSGMEGGRVLEEGESPRPTQFWRRCRRSGRTVHKHPNLLGHAPERLHEEITADYTDMIYAATAEEIEDRRKAFLRKWRLRHGAVADSLEEPATPYSPSPACRHRNGEAPGPPTPSNACTRSSNGGSRPRRCCPRPAPRPCCSGRWPFLARSSCERSTAGRSSRRSSSTGQLTWPPEPIPSTRRRLRHRIPTRSATAWALATRRSVRETAQTDAAALVDRWVGGGQCLADRLCDLRVHR